MIFVKRQFDGSKSCSAIATFSVRVAEFITATLRFSIRIMTIKLSLAGAGGHASCGSCGGGMRVGSLDCWVRPCGNHRWSHSRRRPSDPEGPAARAAAVLSLVRLLRGGNVGDASGSFSPTTNSGFPAPPFVPGDVAALSAAQSRSLTANGFTGGVQAGYNFQHDTLVWGFEADFDYLGLKGSKNSTDVFPSTLPGGAAGPPTRSSRQRPASPPIG